MNLNLARGRWGTSMFMFQVLQFGAGESSLAAGANTDRGSLTNDHLLFIS